jgi:hypothetical protein
MNAGDASVKVEELMATLDSVRKYRVYIPAIASLLIYVLTAISLLLVAVLAANFIRVFYLADISYLYPPVFIISFILLLAGIEVGLRRVKKRVSEVDVGKWKGETSQGFSGAVKVLSELDWESELKNIRSARSDLIRYSVLKTAIYWVAIFLLGELLNLLILAPFLSLYLPLIPLGLIAALISIALTSEDVIGGYKRSRSLEILYWQLRSFYSEFRQKEQDLGVRS